MSRIVVRRLLVCCILPLLAVFAPRAGHAQVGSTTDIITGKVTDPAGGPVEGAVVTATSLETGVNRSRTTDAKGRYTILFPDGGGQYRVVIRKLGFAPYTHNVRRESDEDRLVVDAKMGSAVTQLAQVTVRASQGPPTGQQRPEPGNSERNISPDQAARLPIDASDLNNLAALAPGVVAIAGSDTTAASFSVAGQRPTQNNLTLDGVSFGSASMPSEALRGTRIITNTYDVARGQFTGGQIASTTRGGTNQLQGGMTLNLREPALQWRPDIPGPYGQGYSQNQLSFGVGGPIIKDKLFIFGSGSLSRRIDPLTSLTAADANTLERLGASPDSVGMFLDQLQQLGLATTLPGIRSNRLNENLFGITRVDWVVSDAHTLTLRGDFRWNGQDASRIGSLAVPVNGGDASSNGGGLMATLSSRLGGSIVNELKAYWSSDSRTADPYVSYPQGRVRISSPLSDGTIGVTSLAFGANSSLPSDGDGRTFEGTEEASWISPGGSHRAKLGFLLNDTEYAQATSFNRNGTFTFNSLEDFVNGRPALFTRSLSTSQKSGSALNGAVYLGDTWRQSRAFQLTYGGRLEGSNFSGAPALNPDVQQTFGLRTDIFPSEVHFSPRVGFSYSHYPAPVNDADTTKRRPQSTQGLFTGGPTFFVRGGIGEFRGKTPNQLYSSAQDAAGLVGNESQLICTGLDVPAPDWRTYLSGGGIPSTCLTGTSTSPLSGAAPSVTAFASDFTAPRTWRGSLGVTKRFWERWTASLDAQYAYGLSLYGVRDANLASAPKFALANESGRPVYADPATIVGTTGIIPLAASRRDARFSQVYEVVSDLKSTNAQITAQINAFTAKGVNLNLSYTYANSRDQSSFAYGPASFGFSAPTTAGDPNGREWARSDLDRRHNLIGTVTWPLNSSFEMTFLTRLQSGGSYTPIVGNDINGDGARNDRAFIFDPKVIADTAVSSAMQRLLATAPSRARDCLTSQVGGIAGRNSCAEPWYPSIDFQFNYKPDRFGFKRRVTFAMSAVNSLSGFDQLLHGADNLRGWGQPQRADATLLYVRGFDATTNTFKYQVNERFGATRGLNTIFRQPFQVSLQARVNYNLTGFFGGFGGQGGGRPGGAAGGAAGAAGSTTTGGGGLFGRRQVNPLAQLLELKDSLGLDSAQVVKLTVLADTLVKKSDKLGQEVRALVAKAGNNPDPASLFSTLRPKLTEGRQLVTAALKDAQTVLTPAQWTKVPDRIKNPFAQFQNGDGPRRQQE